MDPLFARRLHECVNTAPAMKAFLSASTASSAFSPPESDGVIPITSSSSYIPRGVYPQDYFQLECLSKPAAGSSNLEWTNVEPLQRVRILETGETLTTPLHWGVVEDGVYRSGFPVAETFPTLARLGVRTVINFQDRLPLEYKEFLAEEGIQYIHAPVKGNKVHPEEMDWGRVSAALALISNKTFHPILVHCRSGKHRTGAVIGCLRMLQRWTLEAACDEYTRYTFHKQRFVDKQFIERFDPRLLAPLATPPESIPEWLPGDYATGCSALEAAIRSGVIRPEQAGEGLVVPAIEASCHPEEPYPPMPNSPAMTAASGAPSLPLPVAGIIAAALPGPDPSELSDSSICTGLGFSSLVSYRNSLPVPSPYGATSNSTPIFLPYYSSEPLRGSVSTVAVIFIHGLSGNANTYFCEGMAASSSHPGTLVLAPWFGNETTSAGYWGDATGGLGETLFWSNSRWSTGGTNTAPPKGFSTSFDLLDALLRALPPSVALVSLVGFSAGAQLTGRYAFASPLGSPGDAFAPHVRTFVGNPGSYIYFTPQRPVPACSPLYDTGAAHTCASFSTPSASACPGYDDYKYGLQSLGYLNLYLAPLDANATAAAEAVARFASKDYRLFLGTEDVCNCNAEGYELPSSGLCTPEGGGLTCSPDDWGGKGCCDTFPDSAASNALDVSCQGMLQGSNRLQRGLNYAGHLAIRFPGYTPLVYTDPYGHNNSGFYSSAHFQQLAYQL